MSFVIPPETKPRWISLTPLIDVVFILLMFFMLTTQFYRTHVMNIAVASEGQNIAPASDSEPVTLFALANQEWRLNGVNYSINDERALARLSEFEFLTVKAAEPAVLQDVISLFDALAKAGISNAVWASNSSQ